MTLRDDIERVEQSLYGDGGRLGVQQALDRIKMALPMSQPPAEDTRPLYKCKCGEEWRTDSTVDQYCPACGERMLPVS